MGLGCVADSVNFRGGVEEAAEGEPVGPEEEEEDEGAEDGDGESAAHDEEVEEDDVDEDGAEDHEGERDIAADEEEQAGDELKQGDDGHEVVLEEDGGVGSGVAGDGGLGKKVQDAVEAEEKEDEAQQNACDENGFEHRGDLRADTQKE